METFFWLKEQLTDVFGENSIYVKELEKKGLDQFIIYINKNDTLIESEVEEIKKLLPISA